VSGDRAGFDTLIVGGRLIDGSGSPWVRRDIGIRDGRIAALGSLRGREAGRVIDAADRYIAPGFVDVHAHSDFALTINRGAESQVGQGITTEVIGNCGFSAYPRLPETRGLMLDPKGVDGDWSTPAEYFEQLGARPTGTNVASLLGHSTIRQAVLGSDDRAPTRAELDRMKAFVREAMEAGAVGMSTGLDYLPGVHADADELVALAGVVAEFNGTYASHLRGYTGTLLAAVDEAIAIGERSGAAVQLSHMGVFGRKQWGSAARIVELVEGARERGVDVTADIMAYPTAGAWWAPRAIFTDAAYQWRLPAAEAMPALQARLKDPRQRAELRGEVERRRQEPKKGFHEELMTFDTWSDIYLDGVAAGSPRAAWTGRSIAELAAEQGVEPVDLYFSLIDQEGAGLSTIRISISEEDYRTFLAAPWVMFGTDSAATSLERNREPFNFIMAHPRHYANFVRVLTHFVRDQRWIRLEEAVRKMSALPALRFNLGDRGLIATGRAADLVVFDLAKVQEGATWLQPRAHPSGLDYVLVNGRIEVGDSGFTGDLAGKPLLRRAAAGVS
jgi:N-acyl-D-aspartate/D-glutamate deacylase